MHDLKYIGVISYGTMQILLSEDVLINILGKLVDVFIILQGS